MRKRAHQRKEEGELSMAQTVGELIEDLKNYPRDTEIHCFLSKNMFGEYEDDGAFLIYFNPHTNRNGEIESLDVDLSIDHDFD